jgi:hypothetical protein
MPFITTTQKNGTLEIFNVPYNCEHTKYRECYDSILIVYPCFLVKIFRTQELYDIEKESRIYCKDNVEYNDEDLTMKLRDVGNYTDNLEIINYIANDKINKTTYRIGNLIHKGSKSCIYNVIGHNMVFKVYNEDDDSYTEELGYKEMYKAMSSKDMISFNFNCQVINKRESDRDTKYLMMEKLYKVEKVEDCDMLMAILPKIYAYDSYFCHADMKVSHIMKTSKGVYTIIDLMLSKQKLLYGYIRNANKPKDCFVSIITIKEDIVELLNSVIRRYTKDYSWLPLKGVNEHEYAEALLLALNIDYRNINYASDIELIINSINNISVRRKVNSILYNKQNASITNGKIEQLVRN